ncbi:EAL domain-containing protein [Arenimonas sp.]|uniref:GGDEF/EAL domain-containing response regulator n=1 Tax=Arenimonas sp. TaxID=1872635 RepID=UPI0025C2BE00|nr:EAL domain-containing protein [Arenimonas sp.]
MAQQDAVIRLLLVEDRLEDAEQLISHLRNGGMAVRPQRPESEEELVSLLGSQSVDMVLASFEAKYLPLGSVVEQVNATGKDIPVIASTTLLDEKNALAALAAGTRDIAIRHRPEHVQAVVRSEFAALLARRGLRHLEASLRETERRCDALIASSRDPIAYVHEGMHIRANDAYLEMFGFEGFDEIEGLSVLDLISGKHAEDFKQLLKKLSKGESPPRQMELQAQRSDGSTFDAVMEFTHATYEGESCLQIVFRQQAVDPDMVKELDTLRQRDALTGLFNRQHFMTELESAVVRATEGKGQQAFLLVEPDHYENLLGEIGLAAADDLIKGIAARLSAALDAETIAARLSDHSFAVLCLAHDHTHSQAQAERIREAFHGHILEVGDRSVNPGVSIGGVQIGEKIASVSQVMGKSSQCLASCVGMGGNRVEIFDPAARDRAEEERIQAWVQRIREALANDQFVLHYQPIISLTGAEEENYDVYLRMKGPGGEVIPPMTYLAIAEEHGLLDDIDRWVVSHAIGVIAARMKEGKHTNLFVKITPASLVEGGLEKHIAEQLKAHGVPGDRLVVQIPESKVFTHLKSLQSFQKAVSQLGCRVALEQFGTGLNSFQMLTHFDPAILKIDRSFITEMGKNADIQKQVRDIVNKAHAAGKQTVAEFVSDATTMSVLFGMGMDFVEGNFLAAAGPAMNYDFG